jgi:predicted hydrocarbon binding protein
VESKEYLPKHLFATDFKPKGKLAEFSIQMKNTVGIIAVLSLAISKHNVRILSGIQDAPSLAESGTWAFFADFTEADIEPEALATELRSLPSVIKVRCQSNIDGFITDTMHFPVLLGTERAIMVRSAILGSIIGRIKSMFGSESSSAQVILYQVGEAAGQRVFDSVEAVVGFDFIRKNVARATSLFTALGWGILNLKAVDLDAKTAHIHIQDGFESADSRNMAITPQCHFVRGLMAGWFSRLFASKIDVIETQCVAKGNPACVFQVQPFKC